MSKRICAMLLSVMLIMTNIVLVADAKVFDDVPEGHEAYEEIGLLSSLGIVEGVGDNMFSPEKEVKRADFVIMLSKVLELEAYGDAAFNDVTPDDYFYKDVMNAANAGVVSGYGDGNFRPNAEITTEEAVFMSVSAYEKINDTVMQVADNKNNASIWARAGFDKAITVNMIDKNASPEKIVTRAEAAKMLASLFLYSGEEVEGDYLRETKIIQKQRGNIYTDADPMPQIEVETGYPIIETVLKDFWGNVAVHRYDKVLNDRVTLDFENLDLGHYYVDVYGRDDKGNRSKIVDTTLSYLKKFEAAPPAENPFGVNFHSTRPSTGWSPDLLYEASLIGVRHVRDEWYWSSVEKEKGVYTNLLQGLTDNCKKYRIALEPVCGFYSPFYDDYMRPYTDEGRTGYANVVNAYYDILGDRELFSRMEMYNEWWNSNTVKGSPAGYQDFSYLKALKDRTQEVVKQNHPDAVLTGMVSYNDNWASYEFFESGCLNSVDELTMHCYPPVYNAREATLYGARPEVLPEKFIDENYQFWYDMTKKYSDKVLGETLSFGITETGCPVDYINQTEHYQGAMYPRILTSYAYYNPEYIHTYDFICDGNNELNKEDNFGLLNAQNSKHGSYTGRPAYVAYAVTARMIDNKDGVDKENRDNIYHYTFRKDNEVLHTFNTEEYDNTTIAINTDTALMVTDCMGESREFVPYNGKIYITLSEDITYVQGEIKSWELAEKTEIGEVGIPVLGSEVVLKAPYTLYGMDNLEYEVSGKTYSYDAIIAPASFDKEERVIKIFAKRDGKYVAQFNNVINMQDKYTLRVDTSFKKYENDIVPIIKAVIKNNSNEDLFVNGICYTVNGENYEYDVKQNVTVGDEISIEIESEVFIMLKTFEMEFRVILEGKKSDYIDAKDTIIFAPLERKTMVIDGILDEDINKLSVTDFESMYNLWQTGTDLWWGSDDCSGQSWVSYDDDNLYLAFRVKDDVHLQDVETNRMWSQDCIQVGFYHESYEEYDIEYDATKEMPNLMWEVGFSLHKDGSCNLYKFKTLQVGEDKNTWENVEFDIKRHEKDKTTVYEIKVPWETLKVTVNELDYYAIELVVQDADAGERSNAYYLTGDAIHLTKNRFKFLRRIIID